MIANVTLLPALLGLTVGQTSTFGPDPNRVDWGTLAAGQNSRIVRQSFAVLENESQLAAQYEKVTGSAMMRSFAVDWIKYKVVAITGQPRPAGAAIFVRAVEKQISGNSIVHVVERVPPVPAEAKIATQSPWCFVKVERSALNLTVQFSQINGGGAWGGGTTDWRSWLDPNGPRYGYYRAASGGYCRVRVPSLLTARNPEELATMLDTLFPPRQAPNLGSIDFARHQLVAITLGERPSGAYGIQVEAVGRARGGGNVLIAAQTATTGGFATMALTQPWAIFRVDREAYPLSLKWIQ